MAGELIQIDLRKLAGKLLERVPTEDDRQRLLAGLGQAALIYWTSIAQQKLRSSSREYVQGLSFTMARKRAVLTLSGTVPNMVENGFEGGDMRQWMLSGPHVKRGKNGRYVVIPFGHGTPGTGERNVGPTMPKSIHDAAKKLSPTLSRPRGQTRYGERLSANSRGVNDQARKILESKAKPWHASSIYTGMIRKEKLYKKAKQSGYQTFRTISEGVIRGKRDKKGRALQHWYHPGIRARHFARDVEKYVGKVAPAFLAQALQEGR